MKPGTLASPWDCMTASAAFEPCRLVRPLRPLVGLVPHRPRGRPDAFARPGDAHCSLTRRSGVGYRDAAFGRKTERGRQLFQDERKAACVKCHSLDGTSSKAGPDLQSIGDKYPRRDLIQSVLEPSAVIAGVRHHPGRDQGRGRNQAW